MTEYRDYLDFMYSVLEKHNKGGLLLSESYRTGRGYRTQFAGSNGVH